MGGRDGGGEETGEGRSGETERNIRCQCKGLCGELPAPWGGGGGWDETQLQNCSMLPRDCGLLGADDLHRSLRDRRHHRYSLPDYPGWRLHGTCCRNISEWESIERQSSSPNDFSFLGCNYCTKHSQLSEIAVP